jgi:succinoglycan biosynthesis transport protein ExoP
MSLKSEMGLNDYINVIKRKLTYVIIFFVIAFVITVAYALYLPPVYESTGTILIESQQVQPNDLAKTTFAEDRFESLKKVVMSNEKMVGLAKKYQLFGLDKNPKLNSDREIIIAKLMRANATINSLQADAGNWGQKSTFAFQVSSQFNTAENSYNIANDIIKLFLTQNEQSTQEKASESAEFFAKEAEGKRVALEAIESQIAAYKRTHPNALPQNVEMQATSIDRLETDLRAAQRERSATEAELRSLEISLESAKSGADTETLGDVSPESELDKLKIELTKQSTIYSENHPAIRSLKRKIEALEQGQGATAAAEPKVSKAQTATVAKLQAQIGSAKARINSLVSEQAEIRAKISRTQGFVMESAQSEGVLGALERKYEAANEEYIAAKAKQDNAKVEKNIQLENKGERLVLVESPVLPASPIKPNRLMLIILGFLVSAAGAVGLAVLIEALDGRVRGVDSISSVIKLQPMATIPYIKNEGDEIQVKYEFYNIVYIVFSIVVLALILVHFFVMPLDEIASKMYSSVE